MTAHRTLARFIYGIRGLLVRGRKDRLHYVMGETEVEIPYADEPFPAAVTLAGGRNDWVFREAEGQFYAPYKQGVAPDEETELADLDGFLARPWGAWSVLVGSPDGAWDVPNRTRVSEAPPLGFVRVIENHHDQVAAEVRRMAANSRIRKGLLHRPCAEPVTMLIQTDNPGRMAVLTDKPRIDAYAFRADRANVVQQALSRVSKHEFTSAEYLSRLRVSTDRLRFDELAHNARAAALSVARAYRHVPDGQDEVLRKHAEGFLDYLVDNEYVDVPQLTERLTTIRESTGPGVTPHPVRYHVDVAMAVLTHSLGVEKALSSEPDLPDEDLAALRVL